MKIRTATISVAVESACIADIDLEFRALESTSLSRVKVEGLSLHVHFLVASGVPVVGGGANVTQNWNRRFINQKGKGTHGTLLGRRLVGDETRRIRRRGTLRRTKRHWCGDVSYYIDEVRFAKR